MEDLKPCPFCGGVADLIVTESGVAVMCKSESCGAQTPFYLDVYPSIGTDYWRNNYNLHNATEKAIIIWNRRANQ